MLKSFNPGSRPEFFYAIINDMLKLKKQLGWHEPNYLFMLLLGVIIIFGLVMLSSASSVMGFMYHDGDNNYYLKHQLINGVLIGGILFFIFSRIDYHLWKKFAFPMIVVSIILLLAVFIPVIGEKQLGAYRWLNLGITSFQPSELVKLTFLIYLSVWLEMRQEQLKDVAYGFMPFLVMLGVLVFIIALLQKDLGTTIILGMVSLSVYFAAGAPWKHLIWMGLGSSGLIFLLIKLEPYRASRLMVFLNPELDPQGIGYHINQALLAIGSGGFWGLGLGHSRQKYNYLPTPSSDSIFAVISEELGFLLAAGLIVLFVALMYQGFKIAQRAPDGFGKYFATGVTIWITFQALVNIAAMLGLVPLTGIPLPFISYGSTSMIVLLIACGILMNISRQTQYLKRD